MLAIQKAFIPKQSMLTRLLHSQLETVNMKPLSLILSAAFALSLTLAHAARAGDIISDGFSGAKGAPISGRVPDTANLPGAKWSVAAFNSGGGFGANIDTGAGDPAPRAYLTSGGDSHGAIVISLAGATFAMPTKFRISASLLGANPALGFYPVAPASDASGLTDVFWNFTGLMLGGSGDLSLYRRGALVAHVKYTGAFDAKAFHRLSYDVDTRSGAISNVSLEGSTSDYSPLCLPDTFTATATRYAALASLREIGRDNLTSADNFLVATIPSVQTAVAAAPAATDKISAQQSVAAPSVLVHSGEKVGFMGDSITALGNTKKGYVQLVIAGLKLAGVDATAIPAGHSGDTSGNMAMRTAPDVLHKGADWMTLSCGVNDVAAAEKNPTSGFESFKKNVMHMVANAEAWHVRVILLTTTPRGENLTGQFNPALAPYNEFFRSFAKEKNLPLADVNAAFCRYLTATTPDAAREPPGRRLLADGLHPNDAGQFLMAMTVLEAMGIPESDLPRIEKALHDSIKK